MRKSVFFFVLSVFVVGLLLLSKNYQKDILPLTNLNLEKPLAKYSIENLTTSAIESGEFLILDKLSEAKNYNLHLFSLRFKPDLKNYKSTTGQINIPNTSGKFPLILMLRGYVDQAIYKTGDGTKNASAFFANNGFITVSPDFLGYGGSDKEAGNIFETRFQTYVTVLSLLNSLDQVESWDKKNVFIWAHSNGGQVALTSLIISGKNYPTVLWAPVTKPFPYSVLYYTDESDDGGKLIRRELAEFEDTYDTDLYSFRKYLDRLQAPIQLNQGGLDDAVPATWSRDFVKVLKSLNKEVIYNEFPKSDHNLRPDWDNVISQDLEFFRSHIIN